MVHIGTRKLAFGEFVRQAHAARISLSSTGFYRTPKIHWDAPRSKAVRSSISPTARRSAKSPSTLSPAKRACCASISFTTSARR